MRIPPLHDNDDDDAFWCHIWQSRIFISRIFNVPDEILEAKNWL